MKTEKIYVGENTAQYVYFNFVATHYNVSKIFNEISR